MFAQLIVSLLLPPAEAYEVVIDPVDPVALTPAGNRLDPALVSTLDVSYCQDHWPVGSTGYDELMAAFAAYNDQLVSIDLLLTPDPVAHKIKDDLYLATGPSYVMQIDYVDNRDLLNDPGYNPCHNPNDPNEGQNDWKGNWCSWDDGPAMWDPTSGGPLREGGVVAYRASAYTHDTNVWSTDLSTMPGTFMFLHEMGHGFGLFHAPDRDPIYEEFQTLMANGLDMISAFDIAWFDANYSDGTTDIDTSELALSSRRRIQEPDGGGYKPLSGGFQALNPTDLYLTGGGVFKDCHTREKPIYRGTIFDMGRGLAEPDFDVELLFASDGNGWTDVLIETVPVSIGIAAHPFGEIRIESSKLTLDETTFGTPSGAPIDATFTMVVDALDDVAERDEGNNERTIPVLLHEAYIDCPQATVRLTGSDTQALDEFGQAVAAHETRIVVGAPYHDYDGSGLNFVQEAGAAYVWAYDQATETWLDEGKLVEGPADRTALDLFGSAVAVGDDLIAVGAPGHMYDETGANTLVEAGAVYLYQWNASLGEWQERQKLVAPHWVDPNHRQADDAFGHAVAVSPNGQFVAVGAPYQDYDESGAYVADDIGAVYVYEYNTTTLLWDFLVKLTAEHAPSAPYDRDADDHFGFSVALGSQALVVGAPDHGYDGAGANYLNNAGAAYLFEHDLLGTGSWELEEKLIPTGTNARNDWDLFGWDVGVHQVRDDEDGRDRIVAVVGAPWHGYDQDGANYEMTTGGAFAFAKDLDVDPIVQVQRLAGGTGNQRVLGDWAGGAVDASASFLLIGVEWQDYDRYGGGQEFSAGKARVMIPDGDPDAWRVFRHQVGFGLNGRNSGDRFGAAVAASNVLQVYGAPGHEYDANGVNIGVNAGAVFVSQHSWSTRE